MPKFKVRLLEERRYEATYIVEADNAEAATDKVIGGEGEEINEEFVGTGDVEKVDVVPA